MQRLSILLLLAIATSPLLAQNPIGVEYVPPQAAVAVVVRPQAIHNSPILQMVPWEVMSVKTNEFAGVAIQDIESAVLYASPPGADGRPQAGAIVKFAKPIPLDSLFPTLQKEKELVPNTMPGSGRRYLDGLKNLQLIVYPVDETTYLLGTPGAFQAMLAQQQTHTDSPLAKLMQSDLKDAEFHAFLRVQPVRELAQFLLADPSYKSLPELQELPQQLEHAQLIGSLDQESGGLTLQLTAPNDIEAAKLETTVQGLLDSSTKAFNQLARPADADSPEGQAIQQYADRVIRTLLKAIQPTRTGNQVTMTTVGKAETSPQMLLASGTALLVPAIANFKAGVNRSQTTNHLRNILLAKHNYFDTYRKMPSDSASDDGKPLLSWRVHILPFLGQMALYNQFHLDEPWDSEHNRNLINKMPATYIPPGSEELAKEGRTRYQHPLGEGLPASKPGDLNFADMTDGTSNTLAVVETPEADAVIWTRPADFEVDLTFPMQSLLPGPGDGINVARYDGSVQYLVRKQLTDQILKGLLTHAGGEVVELRK